MLPSTGPMIFDYKDPKGISAVSLALDSPLEPIVGYAKGISGTVLFDPAHPERASGRLAVDVSSVQFANDGYTATAQGYALNGKKWPQLFLTIRKVVDGRRVSPTRFAGTVLADFTCRGVTQAKRLAVTADLFPGRAEERTNGQHKGDLLVLRTHFSVSRRAHGISEGIPDSMVGDNIEVGVAVVGIHYAEAAPPLSSGGKGAGGRGPDGRWEVELADRDDPKLLRVERTGDRLAFSTGEGGVGASILSEEKGVVAFRLDPNKTFGEAKGTLDAQGNGAVATPEGTVALRGRRVEAFTARPADIPRGKGLERLDLPRRMKAAGTAGMAVVRIAGDHVADVGLYGARRAGEAAPVEESTLFQAGTMGVPVLQATVLRLAAKGRIDLARPANDYLGDEAIPGGPKGWGSRVTVRDLMRGTSGFGFRKSGGYAPTATIPGLRESLGGLDTETEPGTAERVSALDAAFLERIVARTEGRPAAEIVAREVFAPLRMMDSTYEPRPEGMAAGHYQGGEPTLDGVHVYPDALGNGLWTSARDFGRFVVEVGKLVGGRPNLLLEAKDRALFDSVNAPKSVLGIRRSDDRGMYLGGDPYGYFCEFFMHPDKGDAVLVMQNRMMAWRLCNDVVDALERPAPTAKPVAAALPRIGGGTPLSLDEARGPANLVVFFLNEQCGVTVFYKDRLMRMVRDFEPKGFRFVAVRTGRKEKPDAPVVLPERAYLKIPFLDDVDGALMRRFGIGQSMTFAVLDRRGALRYQGGLDDAVDVAKVRRTPLRDALRAIALGKPIAVPRAPAIGCAILPVER